MVKRYGPQTDPWDGGAWMGEEGDGEYVRIEDYEAALDDNRGIAQLHESALKACEHLAAKLKAAESRLDEARRIAGLIEHPLSNDLRKALLVERGATLNEKCPQCGMWHVGLPCPRSFGTPLSE